MFGLGSQELMIIFLIALLLFGAQKLPELARGLAQSVKEFKRGSEEADRPVRAEPATPAPPASAAAPPPAAPALRACASCQATLQPEWSHCPRCGAEAPAPAANQAAPRPPAS